ncbi:Uncharacterized protein APZ42_000413 [Daphnia magna]|uniref:Uncharacterized protein n=1 Tax=Daphnia magna TaxID=35525 RepID=A0A162C9I0_9CRUS|nr:Uncharacterized protein APZ42_000413 [Daphnia magna]
MANVNRQFFVSQEQHDLRGKFSGGTFDGLILLANSGHCVELVHDDLDHAVSKMFGLGCFTFNQLLTETGTYTIYLSRVFQRFVDGVLHQNLLLLGLDRSQDDR